ncbi:MAG: peptidoglycan-binding protein [Phycicoccus sp.]|nr:peptidoglycan-binding protein [Phycicoccus sp.]
MSFQGSKGLPQTGVVDTATWNALGGSTTTTTTSTSAGGERSAWYSTTLRRGSTGEGVMVLQQALGGLTVDGGFGPLTEAAVKEFQADAGLPQTGIVDEATWRALDAR